MVQKQILENRGQSFTRTALAHMPEKEKLLLPATQPHQAFLTRFVPMLEPGRNQSPAPLLQETKPSHQQFWLLVGPVGFEPTTSAESFVYGYPHALPNLLISPCLASVYPSKFILEPVVIPY